MLPRCLLSRDPCPVPLLRLGRVPLVALALPIPVTLHHRRVVRLLLLLRCLFSRVLGQAPALEVGLALGAVARPGLCLVDALALRPLKECKAAGLLVRLVLGLQLRGRRVKPCLLNRCRCLGCSLRRGRLSYPARSPACRSPGTREFIAVTARLHLLEDTRHVEPTAPSSASAAKTRPRSST